jgi:hypothetical protein
MASSKVFQRSFAGGEISPEMFGRIDDAKYQVGLETCLNFIALPQGPIENRPGFAYVNEVKDSKLPTRLIPFVFSSDQTMVVELGDKYARFHTQGKTLMNEDGTAPYEIETPWAAEDIFDLHFVQSADIMTIVHSKYPPSELRRYSLNDWRVVTCDFSRKLKSPTGATAVRETASADDKNSENYKFKYAVSALNADKTVESEPAYTDEVVANLYAYGTTVKVSWDSVDGAAFYRVYKMQGGLYGYIGDTEDLSIIDDDIDPDMSITPRRFDDVFKTNGGIISVNVLDGGSGYPIIHQGIADDPGGLKYSNTSSFWGAVQGPTSTVVTQAPWDEEPSITNIRVVDLKGPGSGAKITFDVSEKTHSTYAYSNRVVELSNVTILRYRVTSRGSSYVKPQLQFDTQRYKRSLFTEPDWATCHWTLDLPVLESGVQLIVKDPTGSGAELTPVIEDGRIVSVHVVKAGKDYSNPTIEIRSPSGSGARLKANIGLGGDFPQAVGYFEQRRVFAGLASDPQRIVMTRTGTESDFTYSLPQRDDDRISHQIALTEFNGIRHIVPLSQLMVMTTGSEVRISPGSSDALTPTSFSARPQSFVGASMVQPIMVNNAVVYCAARGGHVREFAYQDQAGGYVSGDLCLRSAHLFDHSEIVDMAYQRSPIPVLWFVSTSGDLLGLTYIPEEALASWHRHHTEGVFESVACVAEGEEDGVYCVVRRTINGQTKRYIERMSQHKFETLEDAFFVDCGGSYHGTPTDTVSGLTWLEGCTVSILADGAVMPQTTVKDGKVVLPEPASTIHVGLPYVSDCKTLPVILQDGAGGMGLQKNVTKITLRVYQSSGIFVGPTFEDGDLVEHKQRTTEQPGTAPVLQSGEVTIVPYASWSDGGVVCIRQADPLPLKVLSMGMEVAT